jgi:PAS domain S-box-containing protein
MTALGTAGGMAVAYFLAARLGLALLSAPSGVAVFWPASGLAVGILITSGRRAYPALAIGVVIGTVAANLLSDRSLLTATLKGACNAGEAVLVAGLIERWFGRPFAFDDLGRVLGFAVAACLGVAASALGGAATMTLLHTTAPYWDVWRTWFLSDGIGIVVVAPLVIGLGQLWREPPSRRELLEGVGVLALLVSVRLYTIDYPSDSWLSFNPAIVVLPPLMWLLARCPPTFAIVGAFLVSIVIICATTYGIGRYGDAAVPITERVKGTQAVVATGTIFILVLVALFAERRRSEAALNECNNRLQLALDCAELGTWSLHLDTGRYENDARDRRIHGHDPEAPPQTLAEMRSRVHPNDLSKLDTAFLESGRAGDSCRTEYRLAPRTDKECAGRERWVAIEGTVVRSSNGRPAQLLGVTRDITERKQAELTLAERNVQLELAGKAGLVGCFAYYLSAEIMQISQGYAAIHAFPEGTTEIARSKCLAGVHPDDIGRVVEFRSEAFRERRPEYGVEYRIIRSGGEMRWVETRCFISYNSEGCPHRVIGVSIDFTERKLAEDMLAERNLQFAMAGKVGQVGSYAYDIRSERAQISPGYAAIHGLPDGTTEITRSEWLAFVHPEDVERLKVFRSDALRERRGEFQVDYRIVCCNGEVRWIESRGFISYGGDGHAQRLIGVKIDVTERKRAEERQRALLAELDHRVKNALATVSAVISHSRQENGSVDGFALEGRLRTMATTHELLSSRQWQGLSLTDLVRRELAPYATRNNTEINGPEVLLRAEAGQALAMVLHELATNAAKYGALSTKKGRVSIRWDRRLNGQSHSYLVLDWQEIGGPPVVAPEKSGYGTSTIRDLIPYEFGGMVDLAFAPEGMRCRLELPADWLSIAGQPTEAFAEAAR